jgi:hypothetical protein
VSLCPARFRSRGSGGRSGWPSYSHRPASIDPFEAPSIAASLSLHRQALVLAVRGPAPRGASSDGPPAPHRLEQPSPRSSPISDVLRRHRGHRLAGSRTGGKLAGRTSCDARLALTRATETATLPCLAVRQCNDRDAFRRVAIHQLSLASSSRLLPWLESAARLAHRSHLGVAAACVSTNDGILLGQRPVAGSPCGLPYPVTRDASDRLLPFSRLRTSTRASSVPGTSGRLRVSRSRGMDCLFLRQCNSLRRVARGSPRTVIVAGVFFPSRCVRTEPLTSLSPPPRSP